jgi:hypothetical protein
MRQIQISLSARAPLSDLQKEYRAFVRKYLADQGLNSPYEDPDQIADLFSGISEKWAEYKSSNGLTTKAEQEEGGR